MDPLLLGHVLPRCHPKLAMPLSHFLTCILLGRSLCAPNRVLDLDRLDENVSCVSMTGSRATYLETRFCFEGQLEDAL